MMKKALQISIAQTLFTIEDDAYARLDAYLTSVKTHFAHTEGREEIIADIESRIAEQLQDAKEPVITHRSVEKVLAQMGSVEDFGDEENKREPEEEKGPLVGKKRLYRNPDDKFIAGVCSGIAAYFEIDPVWTRLAFLIATFFNGLGIIVYLVLWIVIPEAKTGSQKLEMSGSPVNLETISETVKERVAELKSERSGIRKVVALPFIILGGAFRFVINIVNPVLRVSVGMLLVLIPMIVLVAVLVASGFLFSKDIWVASDIPLEALLPQPLHVLALLGFTAAAVIPLIFLLLGGVSLLQRKNVINFAVASSLLGTWFIALILSGYSLATGISNYQETIASAPAYQRIEKPIDVQGSFSKLQIEKGVDLEIVQSTSTSLTASGRAKYIDTVRTRIENDTLVVELMPEREPNLCFLCFNESPHLVLRTQDLEAIVAHYGAAISSDKLEVEDLHLTLEYGSYGNFALTAEELIVEMTNASDLTLKGTAAKLTAKVVNGSSMSARYLETTDASVSVHNGSNASVSATGTLKAEADNGSVIRYTGGADITESADRSSDIRPLQDL